jgi:hypothetical protein
MGAAGCRGAFGVTLPFALALGTRGICATGRSSTSLAAEGGPRRAQREARARRPCRDANRRGIKKSREVVSYCLGKLRTAPIRCIAALNPEP